MSGGRKRTTAGSPESSASRQQVTSAVLTGPKAAMPIWVAPVAKEAGKRLLEWGARQILGEPEQKSTSGQPITINITGPTQNATVTGGNTTVEQ